MVQKSGSKKLTKEEKQKQVSIGKETDTLFNRKYLITHSIMQNLCLDNNYYKV